MAMMDIAMSHPAMSTANINMQQSSSMHPGDATVSGFGNTAFMGDTAVGHGEMGTSGNVPEWENVFARFGFNFNDVDADATTQGDTGGTADYNINAYATGSGGTGGFDEDLDFI